MLQTLISREHARGHTDHFGASAKKPEIKADRPETELTSGLRAGAGYGRGNVAGAETGAKQHPMLKNSNQMQGLPDGQPDLPHLYTQEQLAESVREAQQKAQENAPVNKPVPTPNPTNELTQKYAPTPGIEPTAAPTPSPAKS